MADPNHHEYLPNKRGDCKAVVGAQHCGLPEDAAPHVRFRTAQLEADLAAALRQRHDEAVELIKEVCNSGISFADDRLSYREVQLSATLLDEMAAWLASDAKARLT